MSVPDISSDIMKLIVLLAYKDRVVVTADQMDKVKDFLDVFGINFEDLNAASAELEDSYVDVLPGKIEEEIPGKPLSGRMYPTFSSEQRERLARRKTGMGGVGQPESEVVMVGGRTSQEDSDDETFNIQGYANEVHSVCSSNIKRASNKTPIRHMYVIFAIHCIFITSRVDANLD